MSSGGGVIALDEGELRRSFAALYDWYRWQRRDLPFRGSRDPYAIWVSEVMLQQTRVAAMVTKWERFVERFDSIESLAAASEGEVLEFWQGLGYYSRARNLHRGAIYLCDEHDGIFPDDLTAALVIPGVGPYTAAAVLSIAYRRRVAAVDGNVIRVASRIGDLSGHGAEKRASELAREWMARVEPGDPGEHNQALMELGATICLPGRKRGNGGLPSCNTCPLLSICSAFRVGGADYAVTLPLRRRKEAVAIELSLYLLDYRGRTLILKDRSAKILRRDWFFPHIFGELYSSPIDWSIIKKTGESQAQFRHQIMHYRINIRVYVLDLSPEQYRSISQQFGSSREGHEKRWVDKKELQTIVVSSVYSKLRGQSLL